MKVADFPRVLTMEWLREKYIKRELTPEDVIHEIIRRAQADVDMNIWITPPDMEQLQSYLESLEQRSLEESPLWGIPFAIKDNIDLAGVPTTAGCPDYAYTPNEHAEVVGRLVAAGAIPLGKTNLDQFATGLVGTRSPYGETHNALDVELISGGSSSGSAVAVARGHAVFSLGTDTAGSGRVPAALNDLVGFKPSLGAWSTQGVVPACESLDCVTVFTHSIDEALVVDSFARGVDETCPWSRSIPQPKKKLPEKICIPKESLEFFGPYTEEYRQAWNKAVTKLEKLGLPIEYVETGIYREAAAVLYDGPWVAERWAALGDFINTHPNAAFSVTEQIVRSGSEGKHSAVSVFQAMHKLQAFKLKAQKQLKNAVLVMPTAGGTWTRDQVRENPMETNSSMGIFTNHCNLLDLCAVAVQSHKAAANLPFGITIFATNEKEDLIFGLADIFASDENNSANQKATTFVAVCGLHMRGYPLEEQMKEHGATFVREMNTAPTYIMVKLPSSPPKPGLIKKQRGGTSIQLEIWEMPLATFGSFASGIPAPLGIGKVELEDGTEVPGFICEGYAEDDAEDITSCGSWRKFQEVASK
jgi:allophanate hydrolase